MDIPSIYVAQHILSAMNSVSEYATKFRKTNITNTLVISERVMKNERKPTEIKQLYNLYDTIGKLKKAIEIEEALRKKMYDSILKDVGDGCKCVDNNFEDCCDKCLDDYDTKYEELCVALRTRENAARDIFKANNKADEKEPTTEKGEEELLSFFNNTDTTKETVASHINELEELFASPTVVT